MRALLAVALWAIVATSSYADQQSSTSDVSRAAAAQLERLAPFRRSSYDDSNDLVGNNKKHQQRSIKQSTPSDVGLTIPIDFTELYKIFSDDDSVTKEATNLPRDKRNEMRLTPDRMQKLDKYADKILQDKHVQSYMERIKRNGYGGTTSYHYGPPVSYGDHYGGGGGSGGSSGAFVSSVAGKVVGSVVGLSSGASKGSSSGSYGHHSPKPVYGAPAYYSYGKDTFSVWDFKKAIINTLIQAVKAVSGGVLALKGQLIKGSGFLVSTKGRVITKAGEAISGLGKNLAASAIVQTPHKIVHQPTYSYGAPVVSHVVSDTHYDGPPPNTDAYHSSFGSASDEAHAQAGLLIAQPTPSVIVHSTSGYMDTSSVDDHGYQSDHHTGQTDDYHQNGEHVLEDVGIHDASAGGGHNAGGYGIKDVVGQLAHTSGLKHEEVHATQEPVIPGNTLQLQDHNHENYEQYPPLGNGPSSHDDHQTVQQPPKLEDPVDFKTQEYANNPYEYSTLPFKTNYSPVPSQYGTPEVGFPEHKYLPPVAVASHHSPDIQLEISNHDITGFEQGGYTSHGHSYYPRGAGLHVVAMQGPLKIPILGPPHPIGYGYKIPSSMYPPGHVNSIADIGKHPGYVDVHHQPIAFGLKKKRDHQSRINRRM